MGYRSNVCIAIAFDSVPKMQSFLTARKLNGTWKYSDYASLDEWTVGHGDDFGILCFEAEDVKWYDDYEDVKWFKGIREDAVDNFGANAKQLRIGEDTNDVEEEWYGDDDRLADVLNDYVYMNRYYKKDIETKPVKEVFNETK